MFDLAVAATLGLALLAALHASGRLHGIAEEIHTPARRGIALALLWVVLVLCVVYPTVSPGAAADVDPQTITFASIFTGQVILAGFLLVWWVLAQPLPLARFLRLEHGSVDDVRFGLAVGGVAWVLAISASAAVALILLALGYNPAGDTTGVATPLEVPSILMWLTDMPVWRKLVVVAVAMTVEEAFFRAFLQTRIGWLPSSALFALSHGGYGMPTLTAAVFAVSLAIGWALRARGNLLPCIVAHGIFDAVQLLVVMPLAIEHLRDIA
jgi:membrane protease YdiL (CAAX protease family)